MDTLLTQLLATVPLHKPTSAIPRYHSQRIPCSCMQSQTPHIKTTQLCQRCDGTGTTFKWTPITK